MWWSTQPSHGTDAATFRAMSQDAIKRHLLDFHAGWHDPIPRILEAAENIVVTGNARRRDPADLVAQAHAADRRCRARHQPACRPGRLAGARRRHAARPADAGPAGAWRNLPEIRGRAPSARGERIVALARRNGNSKREFSATGAWIRDRMLKLLLPVTAKGMDWMYAYDPARRRRADASAARAHSSMLEAGSFAVRRYASS